MTYDITKEYAISCFYLLCFYDLFLGTDPHLGTTTTSTTTTIVTAVIP